MLKTSQGLRHLVISGILLVMVSSAQGVDQRMINVHYYYILEEKSASGQIYWLLFWINGF